jgi:hypothetical protein
MFLLISFFFFCFTNVSSTFFLLHQQDNVQIINQTSLIQQNEHSSRESLVVPTNPVLVDFLLFFVLQTSHQLFLNQQENVQIIIVRAQNIDVMSEQEIAEWTLHFPKEQRLWSQAFPQLEITRLDLQSIVTEDERALSLSQILAPVLFLIPEALRVIQSTMRWQRNLDKALVVRVSRHS